MARPDNQVRVGVRVRARVRVRVSAPSQGRSCRAPAAGLAVCSPVVRGLYIRVHGRIGRMFTGVVDGYTSGSGLALPCFYRGTQRARGS